MLGVGLELEFGKNHLKLGSDLKKKERKKKKKRIRNKLKKSG